MTLVFFALEQEASPFHQLVRGQSGLKIVVTGMGQRNSDSAARGALVGHRPERVLTCGLAGGLDPDLATGTVLFDAEPDTGLGGALEMAGARLGRFHFQDRVASTAAEKRAARALSGLDAVEMESQVIRRLCAERGIPSATIRVILDEAGEDLPLDFNLLMTPRQEMDVVKLAAALMRAPGKIPALIRLQKRTRAATSALAEVLARALKADEGHSSGPPQPELRPPG